MSIKKKMPPKYNGQPRDKNGRFSNGKQNGSRAKGRNIGAQPGQMASGPTSVPLPLTVPRPNRMPGKRPTVRA